jgi:hypothetical protein
MVKQYFNVEEFVPQHIYEQLGDNALKLINPEIIKVANVLRDVTGTPLTINSWKWGGNRNWSGLRDTTSPYYSATSQHTFGNAIDIVSKRPAHELRSIILENANLFTEVTFLECGISWVHVDVRPGDGVKLWVPKRGFITTEEFYAEQL